VSFETPNNIQPREYSKGGGIDGARYINWRDPNGNLNCVVLWSNDGVRNFNLNWIDNHWNDNYRFVGSRKNSSFSPDYLVGGVSFLTYLLHPPIILPISANCLDKREYFLSSNIFKSHNICKKNFRLSKDITSWLICSDLLSLSAYLASKECSRHSVNKLSILIPSVYLLTLEKSIK